MTTTGLDDLLNTPTPPGDWGPWRLDVANYALTHAGNRYSIDLRSCVTSAEVLDWIAQIAGKTWGEDPTVLAGLVVALDELLDFQGTLCSRGKSTTRTVESVIADVDAFAAEPAHKSVIAK
ncbi:hypothetical protein [Rhodococcus sp. T2V]|uniref:hypothetical protein n=1 Tax=Rhodococcus sp. T2V TaxID=3034164 RepID=UPI0023E110C4|nr:hypothetical protein [Rhodococcus sp. T2V]